MSRKPAAPTERRARGADAESLAASWLEARGWRLLDRNHHCKGGEVDLVVLKGETIAFVEVRSRTGANFAHPIESVSLQKRRRVARAGLHWAQRERVLNTHYLRFDVIGIVVGEGDEPEIIHVEGAFDGAGNIA